MPELPEVETTIRYLREHALKKQVQNITAQPDTKVFNLALPELKQRLMGRQIIDIQRYGKWILFEFENEKVVGHLRMSGRYKVDKEVLRHPHNRFQIHLSEDTILNYLDQRKFGTFHLVDSFNFRNKLGPDALVTEWKELLRRLQKTKKPIYSALLDQTLVAGLGNIYVNESLHASHIHPLQPANSLSSEQVELLVKNFQSILAKAISLKGTTLIDNLYQDPEGKSGEFAKMLQVYGKKKDANIQVIKIGGRSVFVHNNTVLL